MISWFEFMLLSSTNTFKPLQNKGFVVLVEFYNEHKYFKKFSICRCCGRLLWFDSL